MTPPSAMASAAPTNRTIMSELFGPLDVTEEQLVTFADGVPGFPVCKQWVLIDGVKSGTAWLQSADRTELTFLLIDPFVTYDGFAVDLGPAELARLQASEPSQLAVFAIVTLPATRDGDATANLQGPVVINVQSRRGAQIVTGTTAWSVQQPLSMAALS